MYLDRRLRIPSVALAPTMARKTDWKSGTIGEMPVDCYRGKNNNETHIFFIFFFPAPIQCTNLPIRTNGINSPSTKWVVSPMGVHYPQFLLTPLVKLMTKTAIQPLNPYDFSIIDTCDSFTTPSKTNSP